MRLGFLLLSALCASSLLYSASDIKKLETQLDAARTQLEMNLISGEIAHYWDQQLASAEARIMKELDEKGREAFAQSCKTFREYRAAQVRYQGHYNEGGSIQPLVHNMAFARLSRARIQLIQQAHEN